MTDIEVYRDLRKLFGPARDQGARPTCLPFAASDSHAALRDGWSPLSCEYAFFHAQRRSARTPTSGTTLPSILEVLRHDGQPIEADWPYLAQLPSDLASWCPPSNIGSLFRRAGSIGSSKLDGSVYAKHGTTIDTRLTVIDRLPADDPAVFPESLGVAPDAATLLGWVTASVPQRRPIDVSITVPTAARPIAVRTPRATAAHPISVPDRTPEPEAIELAYETVEWKPVEGRRITDALYEEYGLQSIRISGSQVHPTKLVQSAAMASVAPPKPSYRLHLSANVVADGMLSDAQLERVINAGEAHAGHLAGSWTVDAIFDIVSAAPDDAETAVQFRRGWFLGDGTGAGKGRQVAGILLDNWLKGRRLSAENLTDVGRRPREPVNRFLNTPGIELLYSASRAAARPRRRSPP